MYIITPTLCISLIYLSFLDPEGILYYNNVDDLKKSGTHYYNVRKRLVDDTYWCYITFRYNSSTATPYAEVLINFYMYIYQ